MQEKLMQEKLEKYAELLVKIGVNLKKDQILMIRSDIECAAVVRLIAKVAYQIGAQDVCIFWTDQESAKTRYLMGKEELFDMVVPWVKEYYLGNVRKGAAMISITSEDPDAFKDVNPDRIKRAGVAVSVELAEYRERMMNNVNAWCVASVPTPKWAQKVSPGVSEEKAMELLWNEIFKAVRINEEDPVLAWENHKKTLKFNSNFLNQKQFAKLNFKSENGTDLVVELPRNHIWLGGSEYTKDGHEFCANMPTEEIFTAPLRTGVHGRLVSSRPLIDRGLLIDEFELNFENGKIIDFSAKVGYEALKSLIETDEGSRYLGEVALVSHDSPISNTGILFYNTLFDENAACHFAIGKAYPICVEKGSQMSKEELLQNGINESATHVDFMIGTKDLSIIGTTYEGEEVVIFKDGNFAIERQV